MDGHFSVSGAASPASQPMPWVQAKRQEKAATTVTIA